MPRPAWPDRDLWVLGRHRLLCGSVLDGEGYAAVMGGKRAALVFTDPPYNVPIAGHVGGLGAIAHRECWALEQTFQRGRHLDPQPPAEPRLGATSRC